MLASYCRESWFRLRDLASVNKGGLKWKIKGQRSTGPRLPQIRADEASLRHALSGLGNSLIVTGPQVCCLLVVSVWTCGVG